MNTGQQLVLRSTLGTASALQHLLNQLAGGYGLVVNDGIDIEVSLMAVDVEIDDPVFEVAIESGDVLVELTDEPITIEVEEW